MSFSWSPGDPDYLLVARILWSGFFIWLLISTRRILLGLASKNWKPITAKVDNVLIDSKTDSDDNTWFTPKITYRFKLDNGLWVTSSKVSYRVLSTKNYNEALRQISSINSGSDLRVYQNKKKPKQTVIFPGVNLGNFLEFAATIIVLLMILHGVQKHKEVLRLNQGQVHENISAGALGVSMSSELKSIREIIF